MELGKILAVLGRRWYVLVPAIVLTIAASAAAYFELPRTYEASGSVLLLSSEQASKGSGGNPYMLFDSSLAVTADVVSRSLMAEGSEHLAPRGVTEEYLVKLADNSAGPLLVVEVNGHSQAEVMRTMQALLAMVPERLDQIQEESGAPSKSRIRATQVSRADVPVYVFKDTVQSVGVVFAAGFAGSILFVFVLDFFLMALARRRRAKADMREFENVSDAVDVFDVEAFEKVVVVDGRAELEDRRSAISDVSRN